MFSKKLVAKTYIAWHVILHFFKKVLGNKTGLKVFYENYEVDRIFALPLSFQQHIQAASQCTHCRRCDTAPNLPPLAPRPSQIVSGFSRGLTDWPLGPSLTFFAKDYQEAQNLCPENVPIVELVNAMTSPQLLAG